MTDALKFDGLLASVTERTGISPLLGYLHECTDFYTAPASTQYHGAYEGGLVRHSLGVYGELERLLTVYPALAEKYHRNTRIIVALLHDVCKANFYQRSFRNVKNEQGVWEQVPCYTINDMLPLGHGEKSVITIQKYIRLYNDELLAIRWHMGGYDYAARTFEGGKALSAAQAKCPLVTLLHMADLAESYFREGQAT